MENNDRTRKPYKEYFFDIANVIRTRSTCPRRRVGAVVVRDGKYILSTGYNGSRSGDDHCDVVGCNISDTTGSCIRTIHAERNALGFIGDTYEADRLSIYVTVKPCSECFDTIRRFGIKEENIHWYEEYR